MTDDYLDLQTETAARIATNVYLAPIPVITEELGDIQARIAKSLAATGVKAGGTGKSGLAFLILTPKGRSADGNNSEAQLTTIRVSLFVNTVINKGNSGHQKQPLTVMRTLIGHILSWNRGPGNQPVQMTAWDSIENAATNELTYFADFEIYHVLDLDI